MVKKQTLVLIGSTTAATCFVVGCGFCAHFAELYNYIANKVDHSILKIFKLMPENIFELEGFKDGLLKFTCTHFKVKVGEGLYNYEAFSSLNPNNLEDIIKISKSNEFFKYTVLNDFTDYTAKYIENQHVKVEWMTKFLEAHNKQDALIEVKKHTEIIQGYFAIGTGMLIASAVMSLMFGILYYYINQKASENLKVTKVVKHEQENAKVIPI